MCKRNWSEYNQKLIQRGSITFLIDPKMLPNIQPKKLKHKIGRPSEYTDTLILLLLMIKVQFRLTYRSLQGFAESTLASMLNVFIPNYTLVCKRADTLQKVLPKLSGKKPHVILLDASGIKVYGEGEWKRKIHGVGRPRKWIKLHLSVDEYTQEIVAMKTTDSGTGDVSCARELVERSGRKVKCVKADGAYDSKEFRKWVNELGGRTLIPPPKNGRYLWENTDRDQAIAIIQGLGGDIKARSLWGKLTGYSSRSLVETAFSRYKRLFGSSMFSKTTDSQKVENHIKCYVLNKMI